MSSVNFHNFVTQTPSDPFMARINLTGMGVALVTPFKHDKSIDYNALARLLEYQIKMVLIISVVLGTTAETATLTSGEKAELREFIAERVAGRVPLVIGVGGNNTMALCRGTEYNRPDAV